ncbi:hypothetical protein KXX11_004045, partial [Aspergillus fumigatus]
RFLGALVGLDVVDGPDRSFGGVIRVDETASKVAPEDFASAPTHAPFGAEGVPLRESRVGGTPQSAESLVARVQGFHALTDQFLRGVIAEKLRIAWVAAHNYALANEDDAHARAVQ